ncbi:MAG: hypothetical protein BGO51_23620 [Rhodospirillales bacterium 69-11]|nr:MAG: hypothetical protein BGO51_23620 [Rhodospirillales bacterium 69-11]
MIVLSVLSISVLSISVLGNSALGLGVIVRGRGSRRLVPRPRPGSGIIDRGCTSAAPAVQTRWRARRGHRGEAEAGDATR